MKKRRNIKFLSVLLSLTMMLSVMAVYTPISALYENDGNNSSKRDTEVIAEKEERKFPDIIEDTEIAENSYQERMKDEEKNLYSFVFKNQDGSRTMKMFSHPVKYISESGTICDISLDLIKKDGGFVTADNDVITTFSRKISDGILMDYNNLHIRMIPEIDTGLNKNTPEAASDDERTVTYKVDGNTSFEYSLTYTGFKEDIVVERYTGQTDYCFTVFTEGLAVSEDKKSYYLTDREGIVRAAFGDIIVFTADNKNNTLGVLTCETVRENSEYKLTIHIDDEYLKDEYTKYPIRIDPEISVTFDYSDDPDLIKDVTIYSEDTSAPASGSLFMGKRTYGKSRTLMQFPGLNDIFDDFDNNNYTITGASVELRDLMCESTAMTVQCYAFTGAQWVDAFVQWNTINPNAFGSTPLSTNVISYANGLIQPVAHRYSFDITSAVLNWKNGTYSLGQGIIFKAPDSVENGDTYLYKTFGSINRATNKPTLVLTYVDTVPSASISISTLTQPLKAGWGYRLYSTTNPSGQTVTWSSSNTGVATVSSTGYVNAVSSGTATITASFTYCGIIYSATYNITVAANIPLSPGVYQIRNKSFYYGEGFLRDSRNGSLEFDTDDYTDRSQLWLVSILPGTENSVAKYMFTPLSRTTFDYTGTNYCLFVDEDGELFEDEVNVYNNMYSNYQYYGEGVWYLESDIAANTFCIYSDSVSDDNVLISNSAQTGVILSEDCELGNEARWEFYDLTYTTRPATAADYIVDADTFEISRGYQTDIKDLIEVEETNELISDYRVKFGYSLDYLSVSPKGIVTAKTAGKGQIVYFLPTKEYEQYYYDNDYPKPSIGFKINGLESGTYILWCTRGNNDNEFHYLFQPDIIAGEIGFWGLTYPESNSKSLFTFEDAPDGKHYISFNIYDEFGDPTKYYVNCSLANGYCNIDYSTTHYTAWTYDENSTLGCVMFFTRAYNQNFYLKYGTIEYNTFKKRIYFDAQTVLTEHMSATVYKVDTVDEDKYDITFLGVKKGEGDVYPYIRSKDWMGWNKALQEIMNDVSEAYSPQIYDKSLSFKIENTITSCDILHAFTNSEYIILRGHGMSGKFFYTEPEENASLITLELDNCLNSEENTPYFTTSELEDWLNNNSENVIELLVFGSCNSATNQPNKPYSNLVDAAFNYHSQVKFVVGFTGTVSANVLNEAIQVILKVYKNYIENNSNEREVLLDLFHETSNYNYNQTGTTIGGCLFLTYIRAVNRDNS